MDPRNTDKARAAVNLVTSIVGVVFAGGLLPRLGMFQKMKDTGVGELDIMLTLFTGLVVMVFIAVASNAVYNGILCFLLFTGRDTGAFASKFMRFAEIVRLTSRNIFFIFFGTVFVVFSVLVSRLAVSDGDNSVIPMGVFFGLIGAGIVIMGIVKTVKAVRKAAAEIDARSTDMYSDEEEYGLSEDKEESDIYKDIYK
ncbi:MAG: hypothetical protein IKP75_00820 [Oscillospiraceae bacterium]|nr:hypothetical protein [Oscillospiraceae bacterium]